MNEEPKEEHRWLQQFVGEWNYEHEAVMAPGQPPIKCGGLERVRSIGGLWVVGEGTGEMPDGGTATTMITLGYDPAKQRFVGTFIGSMMSCMWVYEGALDRVSNTLTLDCDGPDFSTPGKTAQYRDVIELKNADHRILTSHILGEDGKWNCFMTAHYRRVKEV